MDLGGPFANLIQTEMAGRCQRGMSNTEEWYTQAACREFDVSLFFESYEQDADMARTMDALCLSCPVIKDCFEYGCETNSWGLWGAVFLVEGKPDTSRNAHKDQETWAEVLEKVYG